MADGGPVLPAGMPAHRHGTLRLVHRELGIRQLRAGLRREPGFCRRQQRVAAVALAFRDSAPVFLAGCVGGTLGIELRIAWLSHDAVDLPEAIEAPRQRRSDDIGLGLEDHTLHEHTAATRVDQIHVPGEIGRLADYAGRGGNKPVVLAIIDPFADRQREDRSVVLRLEVASRDILQRLARTLPLCGSRRSQCEPGDAGEAHHTALQHLSHLPHPFPSPLFSGSLILSN